MVLSTGDLRHLIGIWRATTTQTGSDGVTTWTQIAQIWAEVRGQDGREAVMEHALQGVSVYRIRTRWIDGIIILDSDQIMLDDGRVLNIRTVSDPTGDREQIMIMADTASVQAMG